MVNQAEILVIADMLRDALGISGPVSWLNPPAPLKYMSHAHLVLSRVDAALDPLHAPTQRARETHLNMATRNLHNAVLESTYAPYRLLHTDP